MVFHSGVFLGLVASLSQFVVLAQAPGAAALVSSADEMGSATGGVYLLGKSGRRVGYIGRKGSRYQVLVDGVAGPLMDRVLLADGAPESGEGLRILPRVGEEGEILPGQPRLFSDDEAHFSYAGKQGADFVVVRDGAEIFRSAWSDYDANVVFSLSPQGVVPYWGLRGGVIRVLDRSLGRVGVGRLAFSADETRVACVTQGGLLVVDGVEFGLRGVQRSFFTADGSHVISQVRSPAGDCLFLDKDQLGVSGVQGAFPVGREAGWGAIVRRPVDLNARPGEYVSVLFMNGKEVPGSAGVVGCWPSPDGSRFAFACQVSGSRFVVFDGRRGIGYERLDSVHWTQDGKSCVYEAESGGVRVFVDGEKEIEAPRGIVTPFSVSSMGGRYGIDMAGQPGSLVVNGQDKLPSGLSASGRGIQFSLDGSRWVCVVRAKDSAALVVDGQAVDGVEPAVGGWASREGGAIALSNDGKRLAYWHVVNKHAPGWEILLSIDGVVVARAPRGTHVLHVAFSPDSQHLGWVLLEPRSSPQDPTVLSMYIDGVLVQQVKGAPYAPAFQHPLDFSVSADGVFQLIAADEKHVRRFRVVAPNADGIGDLLRRATGSK